MAEKQSKQTDDKYYPPPELDQISFTLTCTKKSSNRLHYPQSRASSDKVDGEGRIHESFETSKEKSDNSKTKKYGFDIKVNCRGCGKDGPSCLTDEESLEDTENDEKVTNHFPKIEPLRREPTVEQLEKDLKERGKKNEVLMNALMSLLQILTTLGLTQNQLITTVSRHLNTEKAFQAKKAYSKAIQNSRKYADKKKTTSKDLDVINIRNSLSFQLVIPTWSSEISSNIATCLMDIHKFVYPIDLVIRQRDYLHCLKYVQNVPNVECVFEKWKLRNIDTYPSDVYFQKSLCKSKFIPFHEDTTSIKMQRIKMMLLYGICCRHLIWKLFSQKIDERTLLPFYNRHSTLLLKVTKWVYEVFKKDPSTISIASKKVSKQNKMTTTTYLSKFRTANSLGLGFVISNWSEGTSLLVQYLMNDHTLVCAMKPFVQSRNGLECARFCRDVASYNYQKRQNNIFHSNVSFKSNISKSELSTHKVAISSIQTNWIKSMLMSTICHLHLRTSMKSNLNNQNPRLQFCPQLRHNNLGYKIPMTVVQLTTNNRRHKRLSTWENETETNYVNICGRRLSCQDNTSIYIRERAEYLPQMTFYMPHHETSLNSNEFAITREEPGITDYSVQRCTYQVFDNNCNSVELSDSGCKEKGAVPTGIEERVEICDIHEERFYNPNSHCQERTLHIQPTEDNKDRIQMCTSMTKSCDYIYYRTEISTLETEPSDNNSGRSEMCTTEKNYMVVYRNCVPIKDARRTPLQGADCGNIILRNTCSIDGFLLMIYNVEDDNINLRNQLTNSNDTIPMRNKIFYEIWRHFHNYNFDMAKVLWCYYGGLLSMENTDTSDHCISIDVTGTENERIFHILEKEMLVVKRGCTNTDCPSTTVASTDRNRVLPIYGKEGESLRDTVRKEIQNYLQRTISQCQTRLRKYLTKQGQGLQQGHQIFFKIEGNGEQCTGCIIQTMVDPPLIIPVNLYLLKHRKEKYISTDIPDKVECNNKRYELRMVRFFKESIAHFVDKIKIGNIWAYYDNNREGICYFDEDPNDAQLSSCYYILV